jgi:hypothetical protein
MLLFSLVSLAVSVDARAQDVNVTLLDGSKITGELTALSDTEVTLDRKEPLDLRTGEIRRSAVAVPLDEVRKVERVSYAIRNWALSGTAAGVVTALALHEIYEDNTEFNGGLVLALFTGIGTGVGVGIGTIQSAVSRDARVMYLRPSTTVRISPIVTRQRQGAQVALTW